MVSFNTSQLFHDNPNSCWVPLELTFIASAVVTRMRMRYYGHMAHGTSPLYTSVRSLHNLHSLGSSALGFVNSVETCTSVYNLYLYCSLKNNKQNDLFTGVWGLTSHHKQSQRLKFSWESMPLDPSSLDTLPHAINPLTKIQYKVLYTILNNNWIPNFIPQCTGIYMYT